MRKGFWANLNVPIIVNAPMANVTDAVFRHMFTKYGKPDVMWTEFVPIEALFSEGRDKVLPDLWFEDAERPIVAQIFGGKPEQFEEAAAFVKDLGFDGIDLNMGCPDSGVEKSGAGAALIKDPARAKEIIRATKRGAGDLPVSVKTRLGYSRDQLEEWARAILEEDVAAFTMHLRTRKEMSAVPAHWDRMAAIIALRDAIAPETLVLGNGDIASLEEARKKVEETGSDGVMIGRGIFGSPWFFGGETPDLCTRLMIMCEHTDLFEARYKSDRTKEEGKIKNFEVMKKHFKAYSNGFDGAKELRIQLMETERASEVRAIAEEFLATQGSA